MQLQAVADQLLLKGEILRTDDGRAGVIGRGTALQGCLTALQRHLQLLHGNAPLVQGLADALDGGIGVGRHQDQVRSGFEGQHGGFGGAMAGGNRLHHQGIGHHEPVESQLAAQQVGQHAPREGGGPLGVELRQQQVSGHHAVDPGLDQGLERW